MYKTAATAWALGDIGVGIMAWVNIIAILLLQKPALVALKDYEKQKKEGKDPVFDPGPLGIKMLIFGSMNTGKIRKKKYLNRINEEAKGKPFAFMDKLKLKVIFGTIFEYKKNVHALLGEGEYVDRIS